MKSSYWRVLVLVVVAVAVVLLASGHTDAQCSMCRTALTSASNTKFIRNFNIGVLVLLAPPVAIFCSIFVVLRKYRSHG
ncbi:MAG TPA: hypothetical protein VFI24_19460 [Pyrinomonadaceae bacterium]|nr:hypothetical protein [Pyrinomonadaceae bacterium]